jgi:hypothetical protein
MGLPVIVPTVSDLVALASIPATTTMIIVRNERGAARARAMRDGVHGCLPAITVTGRDAGFEAI